jgi:HEPN domain-containing protein
MKPLTEEWVAKAEADFSGALALADAESAGRWDLVCYHAQQCVEKYLKAVLQESGAPVPRIHHLPSLVGLIGEPSPLAPLRRELSALSQLALSGRYPGLDANADEAERALATARVARAALRKILGLE